MYCVALKKHNILMQGIESWELCLFVVNMNKDIAIAIQFYIWDISLQNPIHPPIHKKGIVHKLLY